MVSMEASERTAGVLDAYRRLSERFEQAVGERSYAP